MPQQPNMQQLLKQAQKMQQDMIEAQESLKDEVVEASAGGGMVTVEVTGDLRVKSVRIDPRAVDPDDPELLADMARTVDHLSDWRDFFISNETTTATLTSLHSRN